MHVAAKKISMTQITTDFRLCQPGARADSVCICPVRLTDDGRFWRLEAVETGNAAGDLDRPLVVTMDFRHLTDVYVGKRSPLFLRPALCDLPADRCFSFRVQTQPRQYEFIDLVANSNSDRQQHLGRLRTELEHNLRRAVVQEELLEDRARKVHTMGKTADDDSSSQERSWALGQEDKKAVGPSKDKRGASEKRPVLCAFAESFRGLFCFFRSPRRPRKTRQVDSENP